MTYILFILGFVLLYFGAHWLITGAGSIGRSLKIPDLVIGLTIVSLGTSLPELIVSVFASVNHETDLAISNVLGSNMANILLILGVTAVITPLDIQKKTLYFQIPFTLLAVFILIIFYETSFFTSFASGIDFAEGIAFLVFLLIFILYSYRVSKTFAINKEQEEKILPIKSAALYTITGLILLYFGGDWVIEGAQKLSDSLGISKSTVGIKIVAVATSFPELVTSAMAAFRKKNDIAIGNVVGSNVFNIFLVLGVSSIITPIPNYAGINLDVILVMAATLILMIFFIVGKGIRLSRFEGLLFLLIYIAFLVYREKLVNLF